MGLECRHSPQTGARLGLGRPPQASAGEQGMRRRAMQDTSEVLQEAKKDLGFFQYEKYFLKSKTFLPLP